MDDKETICEDATRLEERIEDLLLKFTEDTGVIVKSIEVTSHLLMSQDPESNQYYYSVYVY